MIFAENWHRLYILDLFIRQLSPNGSWLVSTMAGCNTGPSAREVIGMNLFSNILYLSEAGPAQRSSLARAVTMMETIRRG